MSPVLRVFQFIKANTHIRAFMLKIKGKVKSFLPQMNAKKRKFFYGLCAYGAKTIKVIFAFICAYWRSFAVKSF